VKKVRCASCKELKLPGELVNLDLTADIREVPTCPACLGRLIGDAVASFLQAAAKGLRCSNCRCEIVDGYTCTAYLTGRKEKSGLCLNCKDEVTKDDLFKFAQSIIEPLFNELNRCGSSGGLALALSEAIRFQHRYLQGEFFGMLANLFKLYSTHMYDARNEWAVKIAGIWERCVGRGGDRACPECMKVFEGKLD